MEKILITKEQIENSSLRDACFYINNTLEGVKENAIIEFGPSVYNLRRIYAKQKVCYISNNDSGEKNIALYLENKKNIIIDGCGANFNGIGRILPFYLERCENITIRNFVIDYQRPFTSQGEVLHAETDFAILKIDKKEFPYEVKQGTIRFTGEDYFSDHVHGLLEFEKNTKRPVTNVFDNGLNGALCGKELEDGILKIYYHFSHVPTPGNILTIKHEHRLVPAIVVDKCKNIVLENIWIKQAGTMGVLAQLSENITINHVDIYPDEQSQRVFSINADATHFVNCKGKVKIENSRFESMFDDVLNVHGNYLYIEKIIDKKHIIVRVPHFQQVGFLGVEPGHKVAICEQITMETKGYAIINNVYPINRQFYEIEWSTDFLFDSQKTYCIDNISMYPEVIFRNNICGKNRARGLILTSTKKTVVENNIIDSEGSCVMINSDMKDWYESGAISNVIIRRNVLKRHNYKNWGKAIVDITPRMEQQIDNFYFHERVQIEDNDIFIEKTPVVHAFGLKELSLVNNHFCVTEDNEKEIAKYILSYNIGKIIEYGNMVEVKTD